MNSMSLSGPFSMADMLAWLGQCIPDIPEKAQGEELTMYFNSTFQVWSRGGQRVARLSGQHPAHGDEANEMGSLGMSPDVVPEG